MARVVVVGAGVGGLAVALRLATAGHAVTVCEAAPQVGGKLGVASEAGFTWDTGPSIVTMPQVLNELVADSGARLDDVLDLRQVTPAARYRWADGTVLDLPTDGPARHAAVTAELGRGAADDWEELLAVAGRMWRAVEDPVLRAPSRGLGGLLRLSRRVGDLRALSPHLSLRELGRRRLRDPRLRMLLDRYATYTGSDPRRAPAALATVAWAEQAFGVWHVAGGLRRIAVVLAALAEARGAVLRTSAPVARITTTAGRVDGVALKSGEPIAADVVVANADARAVYDELLDHPVAASAARAVRRAPRSLSGITLLLGIEGATPQLAQHTVCFPADYDAEFDALFGRRPRPVDDPTLYVSVAPDPGAAPPGCAAWFVLVNAPRTDQVAWTREASEAYAAHLRSLLDRRERLGVTGRVRVALVRSPADLESATGAPGGAIYGSSSNGPAAAFLRPSNAAPVAGLLLVGGSTHPGGGLPLVMLSAATVAGLVGPP